VRPRLLARYLVLLTDRMSGDAGLLRDLALQPPGPRQAEDGTRNLKRLVKRRRSESEWELIDHVTRRVRIQVHQGDSTDEDEDE
jgi:hypothetical protein